ncbi:MAG: HAMP domain-containing histidine kinase [Lachnospiraceae bacterium]|nr:HAMP domain-containing histidine kinase [Lachnospiraceae bacterium]
MSCRSLKDLVDMPAPFLLCDILYFIKFLEILRLFLELYHMKYAIISHEEVIDMNKQRKRLSLYGKLMAVGAIMVILPLLLTSITFLTLRVYLLKAPGFGDAPKGVDPITTRIFMLYMFIAIILILALTASMLVRWVLKGMINPIQELGQGMECIAEGNFDYQLSSKYEGEIGTLYDNYEDMRLKLKESTQITIDNEKKNKELVSNISHDLKTPITAIKGYVEGIMDGVADTPEKMDKYIQTIYNKANDMDRLINELTLYSGISSNRIPYNFHRINVREYFNDCIEEVGLDLESQNIELDYDNLVDEDTKIIADPEQLRRVINNIIGNSIKYMDKEKGIIEIRILDQIDSVRIEIEDNGRGISQKDLPRIFERFYRTDASRNSTKGGSGIGLSIVKKIVEDHGGYIWATSKETEGTCIHFVIRKHEEVEKDE